MSFTLRPLVDDQTFLFPEQTMNALREALPGASNQQVAAAVFAYLEAHPPTGDVQAAIQAHVASAAPHPTYDDMPSFALQVENWLI